MFPKHKSKAQQKSTHTAFEESKTNRDEPSDDVLEKSIKSGTRENPFFR